MAAGWSVKSMGPWSVFRRGLRKLYRHWVVLVT
jgi:hypothetical protein